MAKQVENRVVEMEFKNKDFEKAVSVTMKSLEELNAKLDELNNINTAGFDKLAESANNVNFDKLSSSIDYIASRFSIVGIAVQGVKQRIVEEMAQAANSINQVFSKIEDTIAEKGKTRALNIAQAKFQLQGLGIAWKDVKGSIDEAVNDTRFGLDEAAMAASQLAASGVKLGEDMTHALKGISGVASMTNSEYSEMARIFTSIAGVGKVYRQQLNMISARGLNATAAIAEYLGTSEAAVNEMISSKDDFIDFTTFANAMFQKFGEQATKANDLFTGAFSNAKAALGRIGEKFYTPFYEYARQVLVSVKPVINDINNEMTGIFTSLDKTMGGVTSIINKTLEEIHKSFTEDDYTIDLFGKTISTKKEFEKITGWVEDILNGIVTTLNGGNGVASVLGETFKLLFYNVYEVLKLIGEAIYDVFGAPTMADVIWAIQSFHDFVEQAKLADDTINNLKSTFRGILSVLSIFLKTVSAIYRVFIQPLLEKFGLITSGIENITGSVGDMIYEFDQIYQPFTPLYNAVQKILARISPFTNMIKEMGTAIKETFMELTGITTVEEFFEKIETLAEDLHIADIFYAIGGAIVFAMDMLVKFKESLEQEGTFKDYVKGLVEQNTILSWIKTKYEGLKQTLDDLFNRRITLSQALGIDKLKEHFEWLTPILDTFKEHYKSIFEAYEGEAGKEGLPFIQRLGDSLKKAIKELKWEDIYGLIGASFYAYLTKKRVEIGSEISKTFGSFVDTFQKLADGINVALVKMGKETQAEKILKIAGAIALLSASILLLGKMQPEEIQQGLKYLVILMGAITAMVAFIGKMLKTTEHIDEYTETKKNGITGKGKKKGLFGLFGKKSLFETFTEQVKESITESAREINKTIHDLSAVPAMILSIGASVFLIIGALSKLSKNLKGMKPEELATLTLVFGMTLAAVGVIAGLVLKFVNDNKDTLDADKIDSVSKLFLMMGIAIRLIGGAVSTLSLVTKYAGWTNALTAAGIIIGIMAVMTGLVYEITKLIDKPRGWKSLVAAGSIFTLMALAISMLTIPIAAITALSVWNIGAVWNAVGVISVILALMTGIIFLLTKITKDAGIANLVAGAASMVIMAIAINALMIPLVAITAIASIRPDELWTAVQVLSIITVVMTLMVAIFGILGKAGGAAAMGGMIAGAASMWIISKAIQQMTLALAGLVALETLIPNGIESVFKDFAAGLAAIANVKTIATLFLLSVALTILGAAMVLFGTGILELGAGIKFAGQGLLAFIAALALIQAIDFEKVGQNIANGGAALIRGFVTAMKAGLPDIVDGFIMWIAAGAEALVTSSALIAEAAIKLLADVIIAIDNHSKELGFGLGHALANILLFAVAGIFAAAYDFIGMALGLEKGEGMTTLLKNRLLNKNDNISEAEAKEMTMNTGKAIGKGFVQNIIDGYLEAWDTNKSVFSNLAKEKSKATVDGLNVGGLLSAAITGNLSSAVTMRLGGKFASELFAIKSNAEKQEIKEAAQPIGNTAVDGVAETIKSQDNVDKTSKAIEYAIDNGANNLNTGEFMDSLGLTGEKGADALVDGFMDELGMDSINDPSQIAEDIMKQYDAGGAKGLEKYQLTEEAAEAKAKRVNKVSAKGYGINSPSKVYEQFGRYIDEGLAIGLSRSRASENAMDNKTSSLNGFMDSLINLSSGSLKTNALDGLKDTIANMASLVSSDMDISPTITPILDMSNMNSGFATLDSLFSRDRSIALASDVTSMNLANRALSLSIQNDKTDGFSNGLAGLRSDVNHLGEAIMNTQMVMDTGEVVGVMASPMDRELGRRAIQVKRGGARR